MQSDLISWKFDLYQTSTKIEITRVGFFTLLHILGHPGVNLCSTKYVGQGRAGYIPALPHSYSPPPNYHKCAPGLGSSQASGHHVMKSKGLRHRGQLSSPFSLLLRENGTFDGHGTMMEEEVTCQTILITSQQQPFLKSLVTKIGEYLVVVTPGGHLNS